MANSPRSLANLFVWVAGALGLVFLSNAIQKFALVWHLSDNQQVWLLIAGVVLLVVLGYLVDRQLRRILFRPKS